MANKTKKQKAQAKALRNPHWTGFIDLGGPRFKGSTDKGNSQEKWSIDSTAAVGGGT